MVLRRKNISFHYLQKLIVLEHTIKNRFIKTEKLSQLAIDKNINLDIEFFKQKNSKIKNITYRNKAVLSPDSNIKTSEIIKIKNVENISRLLESFIEKIQRIINGNNFNTYPPIINSSPKIEETLCG